MPDDKLLEKHERAARVLLVDASDRVLLLSSWLEERDCLIWLAPGGALEDGESFQEAARRECREETGLALSSALPHVWNREHAWTWEGRTVQTFEQYFFARVDHFEPDPDGLEEYEQEVFRSYRWWTADELRECDDLVVPEDIDDRLPPLLYGEIPETPIHVGLTPLDNPETDWSQPAAEVTREAIVERLGPIEQSWERLSGGHANTNVRIGRERLLRIYRRDTAALPKEADCLNRAWQHLRVPQVLERGSDFLLLEYVEHGPLEATAIHGEAIGRALADIHAHTFDRPGHLGSDASAVDQPFDGFVDAIRGHVTSHAGVPGDLRDAVATRLDNHREQLDALAESPVLLHGDFKVSNLHWTTDRRPLVLDWEFAWAGPALADVGQLLRWQPPDTFRDAFADAYRDAGGTLPTDWRRLADVLDLVNLVDLIEGATPDSRRAREVTSRIRRTLAAD